MEAVTQAWAAGLAFLTGCIIAMLLRLTLRKLFKEIR